MDEIALRKFASNIQNWSKDQLMAEAERLIDHRAKWMAFPPAASAYWISVCDRMLAMITSEVIGRTEAA